MKRFIIVINYYRFLQMRPALHDVLLPNHTLITCFFTYPDYHPLRALASHPHTTPENELSHSGAWGALF